MNYTEQNNSAAVMKPDFFNISYSDHFCAACVQIKKLGMKIGSRELRN